jgi:lipopolysaccharide transport system permease protein
MEFEIKPASRVTLGLRELWSYRELIFFFTWRDIKIKYKQTFLGAAWAVIQPLLLMGIFTLFFSRALKLESGPLPYPLFVFSGLILWNIFSTGLFNAGNSMVVNANIIKKIYFPRLIIPIASILASLVDFAVTLVLLIVLLFCYHVQVEPVWFLLKAAGALLLSLLTTFGAGTFLAALNVKYRDFRYIIPFVIQVLLFLTPVIYPVTLLPAGWIADLLSLNPMAAAIELLRSGFTGSTPDPTLLLKGTLVSLFLFFLGLAYFRKTEYYFADLA